MRKKSLSYTLVALLVLAAMLLSACQQAATPTEAPEVETPEVVVPETEAVVTEAPEEPTEEPVATEAPEATEPAATEPAATTEPEAGTIGTEENPINVLFVPSVDSQTIVSGGEVMAAALEEATGLNFEVSVPTSYAATIEEMCASPENSMAFIPAQGYVLANQLCGVDVAFKAVRRGWGVYWTAIIVPRDSEAQSIEDLDGLVWAYPDAGSTSGYLVPLVTFQTAGIEPGDTLEAGGHPAVVRAVYNGEADFGSVFYSPPEVPEGVEPWQPGNDPDVPADVLDSCAPAGEELRCGDWLVLDARQTLREEAPDVVQRVRILALSDAIPNDTLSFGPDFPEDLRAEIEQALIDFSTTEEWAASIGSEDFYGWTGIEEAFDEEYDPVRAQVELAGITLENIGQ